MREPSRRRARTGAKIGAALAAVALLATACGGNSGSGSSSSKSPSASGGADAALHAMLPKSVQDKGFVVVATDASYAPIEFFDTDNKTIIGVDPDLGAALAGVLGTKFKFVNASFDGIIPGLASGKYDLGMSSFTDNKEREQTVDFVTYFSAGTQVMVAKGNPKGITGADDLCGHKVAVEKGTVQVDDLAVRAKTCAQNHKAGVTALLFPDQSGANLALQSGRADAVMADSPIIDYAVKQSNGAFEGVGKAYDTAPYGMAIPKTSGAFKDALLAAMKKIIASGDYQKVLEKWGVQDGAITTPVINGAQ